MISYSLLIFRYSSQLNGEELLQQLLGPWLAFAVHLIIWLLIYLDGQFCVFGFDASTSGRLACGQWHQPLAKTAQQTQSDPQTGSALQRANELPWQLETPTQSSTQHCKSYDCHFSISNLFSFSCFAFFFLFFCSSSIFLHTILISKKTRETQSICPVSAM